MRRFSQWLLAAACATLVLGGCTGKQGDPGPAGATGATGSTGTSGQNLTGSIVGYVNPVDENGSLLSKSGVVVSIDGTNPVVSATSNADGRFELTNVRNGTYNLTYTRSGLATYRRYGLGHVGGDQPTYLGVLTLSQVATVSVTSLTAVANPSAGTVTISATIVSPTPTTTFRCAIFASSNFPVTSSTGTLLFTASGNAVSSINTYTISSTVARTTFTNAGFAQGSLVNLVGFGSTAILASYSDPATGRLVYPSLNTTSSSGVSFLVP